MQMPGPDEQRVVGLRGLPSRPAQECFYELAKKVLLLSLG